MSRLGHRLTENARADALPVVDRARADAAEEELSYLEDVLTRGEQLAVEAPAGPLRDDIRSALALLRRRIADRRAVADLSRSSG
jgi:plasmid stabilization system protein ParE